MSGSMIPFSAIDAISSERSPMTCRGWFGFGVDLVDRHHAADRAARRARQGIDVVLVVPHPDGFRESSLRHGP